MQVGVAYRDVPDSYAAGASAVTEALEHAGLHHCDLVLTFATAAHDATRLRDGVLSVTGSGSRLVGGEAVGALTNKALGYGGYQVGVAVFDFGGEGFEVLHEVGLADAEERVGQRLGRRIHELGLENRPQLLIYDSVNRLHGRMRLNMATPLLDGIEAELGDLPDVMGAGLCGDMLGSSTRQIVDGTVNEQSAILIAFPESVRMHTAVMHGCHPVSDYMTITRAEGATVLEIDGRPAIEVISDLLGGTVAPEQFGFFVTLGRNMGDRWAPYDEGSYINRLCLKVDRERQALHMFEPDLETGTEVQLMHRDFRLDYMVPRIEALMAEYAGRRPLLALYIDCAGRAATYAGIDEEDAAVVQSVLGEASPLLGMYSGVEIGPILGKPRPLDWTGVLGILSIER